MELSQDRSDVFSTGRAANQTSSGVLDGLKALQVDISNTSQQQVAVVQPGVDKRLYQCTNSVRGERLLDRSQLSQLEKARTTDS